MAVSTQQTLHNLRQKLYSRPALKDHRYAQRIKDRIARAEAAKNKPTQQAEGGGWNWD